MNDTKTHAVVVVGCGPTGMMLACELALAGVDVAIVERRPDQRLEGSRAGGLHARTLEVLDQRGVAGRFMEQGKAMQVAGFALNPLDISDLPSRFNHGLALWQDHIERIMALWVDDLEVPVYRGRLVAGFSQDASGVDIALSSGDSLRAGYLVGCDGGRSVIRKQAGIEFPGYDASASWIIAEVEMAKEVPLGFRRDEKGFYSLGRHEDGKLVRVLLRDPKVTSGEPTTDDLRAALVALYGSDFGLYGVRSLSRFSDMTRQAAAYRDRRVLLAGDAAHVHAPATGQGLNLGVQDAVNLGWKLAQVVKGVSPDSLLDSYHAERHPVAARALKITMASIALSRGDDRVMALGEIVADMLTMDQPRMRYGAAISGLDIRYDMGPGHPLLGRRMPDLDLGTSEGPRRLFSYLHRARPLLLDLRGSLSLDLAPWADRVQHVEATCDGPWELPLFGAVPAPQAALVRPDGHVAWVGEGTNSGLREALLRWFGEPA